MNNAVGYTRLSQDSDTSIDRQKRHIREYAEEKDLDLEEIYDDGERSSGWDESREEYQEVRDRVQSGKIEAVIVNDKRRLARDFDETMRLVLDLREHGVEAHTYQEGQLDLSDPVQAAVEVLQAASEHESKKKEIERAREAVQERIEDPDVDHGRPRFGMTYNDAGTRQVPGDRFGDVLEIFRMDTKGSTLEEIADEVGTSVATVSRVLDRREWYVRRDKEREEA